MRKKILLMARDSYLVRFAKWLNQVDDAKIDFHLVQSDDPEVDRKKARHNLAEQIYLHLLYK